MPGVSTPVRRAILSALSSPRPLLRPASGRRALNPPQSWSRRPDPHGSRRLTWKPRARPSGDAARIDALSPTPDNLRPKIGYRSDRGAPGPHASCEDAGAATGACRRDPLSPRDDRNPGRVSHRLARFQPRSDPLRARLPRQFRRGIAHPAERGLHQGEPVRHRRTERRGRRGALGAYRRGANRRAALGHRPVRGRRARWPPLRARHVGT